jgi:putative ATP-binding cassette transporter
MRLKIFSFASEATREKRKNIVIAFIISGITNGLFMLIINSAAEDFMNVNMRYVILFFLCMLIYTYTKKYALRETLKIIQNTIFQRTMHIITQVRKIDLNRYEEIGESEIYSILMENGDIIYEAARMAVSSASAIVMLIFSFGYIFFLSKVAFWISVVIIFMGVMIYLNNQKYVDKELHNFRKYQSIFYNFLEDFLKGFKEIKVNSKKGEDLYYNYLKRYAIKMSKLKLDTETKFISNIVFTQLLFFILMAAIAFLLPQFGKVAPSVIISIVAIILFIAGPIGVVVDSIPIISKAEIAMDSIMNLEELLLKYGNNHSITNIDEKKFSNFQVIKFKNLLYNYKANGDIAFTMGPIDLDIRRGELLFLIGGNGSGKTTFLKTLSGLYPPDSGLIMVDGVPINQKNYQSYREIFSIIFTDFYLFKILYGYRTVDESLVNTLIKKMKIENKTGYTLKEGFSNIKLSTGQRKRLALITSLVENKPVCLFDEVAADQDPEFREYFYYEILKELQRDGKTLIVVSHDDRYFHLADRIIKMDFGKIEEIIDNKNKQQR